MEWCRTKAAKVLAAGALFAMLALAGCASLKPIQDFGRNAGAVVGFPEVAKDYPLILDRQQINSGRPVNAVEKAARERDSKRLLEAQTVLENYAKTLGALAADDLVSYAQQVDALNQSLVSAQLATSDETAKYAQASKLGLQLFTDLYRRAKLKKIILTYNPAVQKAVAQLILCINSYREALDEERTGFADQVEGPALKSTQSAGMLGLPALVRVLSAEHLQSLQEKDSKAKILADGIQKFGQGHEELAKNIQRVSFKDTMGIARSYAAELKAVIQAFNPNLPWP